ncbi:hypothetical protein EC957_004372 [Mortierella hygrophila]|uniref:Uncharacterized protein n=1 Tax=Mortierella hygrophila TaxID=979708 RepID=A0A9P6K0B9_9FUNG|nr:hypothetical protein EC957_004372 [Mortierella hygrophila]
MVASLVITPEDLNRASISSKERKRFGSESESKGRATKEINDNNGFGYYTEEDVCRIDEGEEVIACSSDDNEEENEDEIEDESKDEVNNEDESVEEDQAPIQADLDKTKKKGNKDSERKVGNNQHTEFMEEFNNDRSIIESGRTLTDGDIELVKESINYRDEDCVAFTLLKDVFPIWLAEHERFLGVTFYKKGNRQCREVAVLSISDAVAQATRRRTAMQEEKQERGRCEKQGYPFD